MTKPSREAVVYFALTFCISWSGALAVVAPKLLHGAPIGKFDGLMMFPVMLVGPCFSGIVLSLIFGGWSGVRDLFARIMRFRFKPVWFLLLSVPWIFVYLVLRTLEAAVSPAFSPNNFIIGLSFGLVAGFLEEIGWTGFVFPRLLQDRTVFRPAVVLGLLWGLWHLPVVDFLGAATPHGASWLSFALIFVLAMTAMRVIISWAYVNTRSVGLAQLIHAGSTGALVVLSPQVSPAQEVTWYAIYALALWVLVLFLLMTGALRQRNEPADPKTRSAG